jgi:hypothetical protein
MATFVHVSEGDDAATARDVLVIEEPALIRAIGELIARRLGSRRTPVRPTVVPLKPGCEGER